MQRRGIRETAVTLEAPAAELLVYHDGLPLLAFQIVEEDFIASLRAKPRALQHCEKPCAPQATSGFYGFSLWFLRYKASKKHIVIWEYRLLFKNLLVFKDGLAIREPGPEPQTDYPCASAGAFYIVKNSQNIPHVLEGLRKSNGKIQDFPKVYLLNYP